MLCYWFPEAEYCRNILIELLLASTIRRVLTWVSRYGHSFPITVKKHYRERCVSRQIADWWTPKRRTSEGCLLCYFHQILFFSSFTCFFHCRRLFSLLVLLCFYCGFFFETHIHYAHKIGIVSSTNYPLSEHCAQIELIVYFVTSNGVAFLALECICFPPVYCFVINGNDPSWAQTDTGHKHIMHHTRTGKAINFAPRFTGELLY